jgi:hypothetical protein
VLNPTSEYPAISTYILDRLNNLLVNTNAFIVLDRENLNTRQRELLYQAGGTVSDESAQSLGNELGAQFIITGSLTPLGNQYRLTLRAISVESGVIPGAREYTVKRDRVLNALLQHRLYLGARAGASLPFYDNAGGLLSLSAYPNQRVRGAYGFDAGLYASVPIWSLLEMQAEAVFTTDAFTLYSSNTARMNVSYTSLMIPLLAKVVWRPAIFMVQGYGGAYVSLPLGQLMVQQTTGSYRANYTPPPGFVVGGGFGMKLGAGVLLADVRYASDFSNLSAQHNGTMNVSKRSKVVFSLGYEFGVIKK